MFPVSIFWLLLLADLPTWQVFLIPFLLQSWGHVISINRLGFYLMSLTTMSGLSVTIIIIIQPRFDVNPEMVK